MIEKSRLIQLVKLAQDGNPEALEALCLDCGRSVYYLALKILRDQNDAEDIAQEVFITMQEKISGLKEPAAFYKWLNQITANKCTDLLRKHRDLNASEVTPEGFDFEEDEALSMPDRAYEDFEVRQLILSVIDDLPTDQRVCVMMYYYQQLTVAQISESIGVNENTVKSRLALARGKIRDELERKEREEGIKLYVIPLPLTPILRQAAQEFQMPDGLMERIWENVSQATGVPLSETGGGPSDHTGPRSEGIGDTAAQAASSAEAAAGAGATATGMALATKIIIGIVAAAVIVLGAIFIPRLSESPPEEAPPPVVTDAMSTALEDTESPEPPEPECEHIWVEANYQQSKTCSVCGDIEGSPLSAAFEDNGYVANMAVGVTYDYTTLCYDDPSVSTTGTVIISDYIIVSSDETHEAMEGYEWRIIRVESEFSDNNAREYGRMFRQKDIDYYSGEMFDLYTNPDFYAKALEDEIFTVSYDGKEYECVYLMEVFENGWINRVYKYGYELALLVPMGYDGCVLAFHSAQYEADHNDSANTVDLPAALHDSETLIFRAD